MSASTSELRAEEQFRSQFPVLERFAYLNAGTEGPVPAASAAAVRERVDLEAGSGRCGRAYHDAVFEMADRLRAAYAQVLGCSPSEVALTGSTTDGCNTVLAGLDFRDGDEILTSDEEHPGLLAPLGRARRKYGVSVRVVPFERLAEEVGPATRLVACSHVSWVSGRVVDSEALRATGVSVLLDGAQGVGAVPVDVAELGCDFYAGSGQKWLCGPEGSGALYVRKERLDDLLVPWPGYGSVADPLHALDFQPADGAGRLDHGFPTGIRSAYALASLEIFEEAGWSWVHNRAATLAEVLAQRLLERGYDVWPRGSSTLVSFPVGDPPGVVDALAADGIIVRSIPAFGLVRVSLGAWSSEEDIVRLLDALPEP